MEKGLTDNNLSPTLVQSWQGLNLRCSSIEKQSTLDVLCVCSREFSSTCFRLDFIVSPHQLIITPSCPMGHHTQTNPNISFL